MVRLLDRRRTASALACCMLVSSSVSTAVAESAIGVLRIGARVGPRVKVTADRDSVTLAPGASAVVLVTVRARLAQADAVDLTLLADRGGSASLVTYAFGDRRGALSAETRLGVVQGAGIRTEALVLTLDRKAPGPVPIALGFDVRPSAAPL
jgi:hypothetical protein